MATPPRWFSHNNGFYPLFDANSFNQQIDWATAMAPLIKSVVTSLLFRSHGNTQETSLHQLDSDWNDSSSSTHTRSCSMRQYYWHQQSSSFPLGNNSQDGWEKRGVVLNAQARKKKDGIRIWFRRWIRKDHRSMSHVDTNRARQSSTNHRLAGGKTMQAP